MISSVATSRVASVRLDSKFYANFGQTCSNCIQNRYLTCLNMTCQCPPHFFWNGATCENQGFAGAPCNGSQSCRTDQNGLICSEANTCASKSSRLRFSQPDWKTLSSPSAMKKLTRMPNGLGFFNKEYNCTENRQNAVVCKIIDSEWCVRSETIILYTTVSSVQKCMPLSFH